MRSATHPASQPNATSHSDDWPLSTALAIVAIVVPSLLAFNVPPSATFFNQAAALVGWGAFMTWVAATLPPTAFAGMPRAVWPGLMSLGFLGASALWACAGFGLPAGLALSAVGLIAAAMAVLMVGAAGRSETPRQPAFGAFCVGLLLAGLLSLLVAVIQYFFPQWTDGNWLAHIATPGRAGGNLRQPNHLSSLLLWAMAALIWLHDAFVEKRAAQANKPLRVITAILLAGLTLGVVLTVSRTGTVCIMMLALWGVLDKHLSRYTRVLLWLTPLVYVLCWMGVAEWAQAGAHAFAGSEQLHKADPSSSRFGIWSNTLSLIAQHPWLGVGWGEFNLAWSLTPFPGRPGAFFDHTHNIVLQFLVELGIPIGTLVLVLLAWALWKGFVNARLASAKDSVTVRCAFMMVLMMVVHSMLEYPLWYAYFLLPTAFAFGICLGRSGEPATPATPVKRRDNMGVYLRRGLIAGCIAMVIGATASVYDYMGVAMIFAPTADAAPLPARIVIGQRSWFFAHHADYAAATTADHPSDAMPAFKGASYYLLDTRLMMAWAQAFNERGDVERARYIAARLREFNNAASEDFFAECDKPRAAGEAAPFQCTLPTKAFVYEDFK